MRHEKRYELVEIDISRCPQTSTKAPMTDCSIQTNRCLLHKLPVFSCLRSVAWARFTPVASRVNAIRNSYSGSNQGGTETHTGSPSIRKRCSEFR